MIEFITGNWAEIVAVLGATHALAAAVVNLTPTPKDNEVLEKVYRVVETIGGVVTDLAKQYTPDQAERNMSDTMAREDVKGQRAIEKSKAGLSEED